MKKEKKKAKKKKAKNVKKGTPGSATVPPRVPNQISGLR
jgi:hypothetical protein